MEIDGEERETNGWGKKEEKALFVSSALSFLGCNKKPKGRGRRKVKEEPHYTCKGCAP